MLAHGHQRDGRLAGAHRVVMNNLTPFRFGGVLPRSKNHKSLRRAQTPLTRRPSRPVALGLFHTRNTRRTGRLTRTPEPAVGPIRKIPIHSRPQGADKQE